MGFEAIGLGEVFGGYHEKSTAVYKRKTAGRDTRKEERSKDRMVRAMRVVGWSVAAGTCDGTGAQGFPVG